MSEYSLVHLVNNKKELSLILTSGDTSKFLTRGDTSKSDPWESNKEICVFSLENERIAQKICALLNAVRQVGKVL